MKSKLFSLCLMAALCFPFMVHSQEIIEATVEEPALDTYSHPRKLAMDYYKDLSHWTIFIEPSVTVNEDTAFDKAGLKHAYYVRRFYFFAVPEKADFQYQPQFIGPFLYAYGQKMPIEGKDTQHFQMIRNIVFPFAADFSASTPSRTIFQQYVEKNFDKDYHYIIDSLMVLCVNNLKKYDFKDTAQKKSDSYQADYTINKPATTLSCLENEYAKAIPQPTILEAPAREPIATPKSIEHLKKVTEKTQGNIYILPQNTILNQIAQEMSEEFKYNYGLEGYSSSIAEMTIRKNKATESEETEEYDEDYYEEEYYEENYYFSPVSVSGQSYYMLNDHTVLLHPEMYWRDNEDYDYSYLNESWEMHGDYYDKSQIKSDSVIILSPGLIETMTLTECYRRSLKDTANCTCSSQFPPVLKVYVDDEIFDYDYYEDCKECYTKSAILERLNEGSVLYDYFEKDFYKNDIPYKDFENIEYHPSSYRYWDWTIDDEDDVEYGGADTIYLTKKQSQQIRKLLVKRNRLINQGISLMVQYYKAELEARIPKGQLHLTKSWEEWEIEGENTPYEGVFDDELVVVGVDNVGDVANKKIKKTKPEKKLEKIENKVNQLDRKITQINKEIEKIAGHPISKFGSGLF